MTNKSRVIAALDMGDWVETLSQAKEIRGQVAGVKIHAAEDSCPGDLIGMLRCMGHYVWVDFNLMGKSTDVVNRYRRLWARGADSVSFTTMTSMETMRELVTAPPLEEEDWARLKVTDVESLERTRPFLIGMTVPTYWDDGDLGDLGFSEPVDKLVGRLADRAYECGVRNLVCSPLEATAVRARYPRMTLFCPGIRPTGAEAAGQKRFATPRRAVLAGADYLVIGSPIYRAKNPLAELNRINGEVARALAER